MSSGYNLSRLYGTSQVAGHHDIDGFSRQPLSNHTGLFPTPLVQTALRLSLHDLPCIIHGLSMPH